MILGLDIGGTKISVGLVMPTGRVRNRATCATRGRGPLLAHITGIIRTHLTPEARAIGIGIAGGVDTKRGIFLAGPNLPKNFRHIPLQRIIKNMFKVPVLMDNDASCFTLAEATIGAGRSCYSVMGITLGTGIGGGLVRNKKIARRNTLGHMNIGGSAACSCSARGHVEAYASGPSLLRRYRALTRRTIDMKQFEVLYKKKNAAVRTVLDEASNALARGIANLIANEHPDCIVIGGGLANFSAYLALIKKKLAAQMSTVPILTTKLGPNAGLIGATLLFNQSTDQPVN